MIMRVFEIVALSLLSKSGVDPLLSREGNISDPFLFF